MSSALSDAGAYGISVIWLGRDSRDLPGQAGAIVEVMDEPAVLALTEVSSGVMVADASAEGLSLDIAEQTARLLAPVRDISELARAGDIPRQVGLLDLLDLLPPSAQALEDRWSNWDGALRATVGVSAQGVFNLDVRSEGPHALIAGTTGSGKSELLRTLVAAAAAAVPPNRLSFLLVDYKGGSAFAPCATLPHVVDVVSDLDEHLAERALISLNAELKRRERTLAEKGARDLLELARRDPDGAPPLLIIAVDEFAKLREEVPDFVDGVVDIAQRGRSLGVHMVLAAQTLRNAFTPAIRANTNLRLALRVAEETESEDMISSPLAARIPSGESSRGRAYARTGHGELREFQAAYVSGRSVVGDDRVLKLTPFELVGELSQSALADSADSDTDNDLTALGQAAREAQKRMGLGAPVPPWLPMLPTLLSLDALEEYEAAPGRCAIGLVDRPHLQRQDPLVIDLSSAGHVAVFGGGNSGKTTVLTSTALALTHTATPEQLCIYGLDAGSGRLGAIQALPHCRGVVSADDEERVERLFRELIRRIERKGNGAQPRDSDGIEIAARTVLLLDDLGSFAHQYDRPGFDSSYEHLQRVLASGRAAGVHVILTASRRGALTSALAAHIGQRLMLRMPTEEDMLSLGLDAKTIRGARLPVGRGFTQDSQEFQIAVPAQDGEMLTLQQAADVIWGTDRTKARAIEVLPTQVTRASLGTAKSLDRVPLGIADENLETATVDLTEMHLLVVGPYRSGRSTALGNGPTGSARLTHPRPCICWHRDAHRCDTRLWSSAATTSDACKAAAISLVEELEAGRFDQEPAFLLIDDGGELAEAMVLAQLEHLVRGSRDSALRIVAAVETGSARGVGLGWIREVRREGHGLLLQPDLTSDGDLLGARLPRRVPAALSPGRGFLVFQGSASFVQVAQ